jgi:hypothetical protein
MTENTIEVQPMGEDASAVVVGSEVLAILAEDVGEPAIVGEIADVIPSGRTFPVDGEPLADGVIYRSTDDVPFYRPVWRVADRGPGMVAGPDVWFTRDADGTIGLRWTVADVPPPDAPAQAWSLAAGLDKATVVWNGGSQDFDQPVLEPRIEHAQGQPRFLVRGAVALLPDRARALELAMSDAASGCRLEITTVVGYRSPAPYQPADRPRIILIPGNEAEAVERFTASGLAVQSVDLGSEPGYLVQVEQSQVELADQLLKEAGLPWSSPEVIAEYWESYLRELLGDARFEDLTGVPGLLNEHDDRVVQSVPFVFNPNDDPYRPIYRALHGAANLTETWQKSAAGWLRAAPFPNTIYRIPDEMRLAFNPDMGTPHVVTTLHADEQGRSLVRVLLRVAPWQDPHRIVETRALARAESATVIVGPVRGAALRLGGSFPEAVRVVGAGSTVAMSLSDGADLLLDLSLEYFQLLCDMLGGSVGLPGDVEVQLDDQTTATVPVSLRMDKVHDLPVGVEVQAGDGSPRLVRVTNRSGTAIRVGGCAAAFLRLDSSSVFPMAAYPARCLTPFPLELAAGGTADLTFEPAEPNEDDRWNAVLVELLDKVMVEDARATLLRTQELAGSGELTWDLTISSPVFIAPQLPARWANLANLEVEVSAPGFETTSVVLRKDAPSRTLTMRKPLAALVSGAGAGIHTATYRIRNNYLDHQGHWTDPQQQSGEELVVFPNPADGD